MLHGSKFRLIGPMPFWSSTMALCGIALDHGPAVCRTALDNGPALCCIARNHFVIILYANPALQYEA
jgi:hypothetical protein